MKNLIFLRTMLPWVLYALTMLGFFLGDGMTGRQAIVAIAVLLFVGIVYFVASRVMQKEIEKHLEELYDLRNHICNRKNKKNVTCGQAVQEWTQLIPGEKMFVEMSLVDKLGITRDEAIAIMGTDETTCIALLQSHMRELRAEL